MLVSAVMIVAWVILTLICLVYAIEATVHAPTWEGVYGEIKKVLKPGGIVSIFYLLPVSVV